jgi:DNA repair protein RadC
MGTNENLEVINVTFNEQLKQYIDGTLLSNERLTLGRAVGNLANQIGNNPISIKQSVFRKAKEKHGINLMELHNLPKQLNDPIFIFNSKDGNSKTVLIDAKDADNRNVLAAIHINAIQKEDGKREIEVNSIQSLHGKDFIKLIDWIDGGLLVYANNKKSSDFLIRNRAQFPSGDESQNILSAVKVVQNNEIAKLSVKDWSPDDQPREKLLSKGVQALSDAELLAIILGSGSREESVVELSRRMLQSVNHQINQLGKLSVKELMRFKGIGEVKAISVIAAMELGKRRKTEEMPMRVPILLSKDIYTYFYSMLCDLPYEEFWVLFLNRSQRIIDKLKISQGGVSSTVVDAQIIYKEALMRLASSVVLCHNHPSGNATPSPEDDKITHDLQIGLKFLDLQLKDHIILCDGKYYSYADAGRI